MLSLNHFGDAVQTYTSVIRKKCVHSDVQCVSGVIQANIHVIFAPYEGRNK